jgi:hypothetical protein
VDQGRTWFCRRLCETGGYTTITQTRDGLIHVCGDMDNRPGGAFIQVTFSEQWLREGNCLPVSQWGAPNPPADQVGDCSGTEPAYFDTLYTPAIRVSGLESSVHPGLFASPNPFNPSTLIRYSLPGSRPGTLSILNVKGERVFFAALAPGQGRTAWEAKGLPSGLYLARLSAAGGLLRSVKLVRIR